MEIRSVLVTGLSGLIGQSAKKRLESHYNLSALGRHPIEGVPFHLGDIRDLSTIEKAFEKKDAVIHLAGAVGSSSRWEDVRDSNLIGTYNVFETCRRAGVKRIVFASSGGVVGGYEKEFPYDALTEGRYEKLPATWKMLTHDDPPRPRSLYCCSKIWGEALARHYADEYGISIICIRFGRVTREDRPMMPLDRSIFCSQNDASQIIEKALCAPDALRFGVFFATSNNKYSYRDISHTFRILGFVPKDNADEM